MIAILFSHVFTQYLERCHPSGVQFICYTRFYRDIAPLGLWRTGKIRRPRRRKENGHERLVKQVRLQFICYTRFNRDSRLPDVAMENRQDSETSPANREWHGIRKHVIVAKVPNEKRVAPVRLGNRTYQLEEINGCG